ncbi:hypothetical protein L9F63_020061 [Diploptera punctata]|uniref:Glucose-methanol-choline oxidoreductase N-terminal domain-containing protein n=1 Tax=Diploptera punctata TaxID=6984 RepID=A0AAD7ZUW7_DIPPU|nr:hypothetical protein L9F63_020061 [Diploptera punctata]
MSSEQKEEKRETKVNMEGKHEEVMQARGLSIEDAQDRRLWRKMSWVPPDIASLCQPHIESTSCLPSAALFLQLISQLFGYSPDQYSSSEYDTFFGYNGPASTAYNTFFSPIGGHMKDFGFGQHSSTQQQQDAEEFDFIIVGAGSAGCVIANRLSEIKQWKILLLEAGIEEPFVADIPAFAPLLRESNIDWMYRTQPQEYNCKAYQNGGCAWARGKVMGGSSVLNYMIYVRGNMRDYDEWAEMGNHGWSYEEVLPYFLKSEDNEDHVILKHNPEYHSKGGYQTVEWFPYQDDNIQVIVDSWKALGFPELDVNADSQIGVMVTQHTLHAMGKDSAPTPPSSVQFDTKTYKPDRPHSISRD